MAWTLDTTKECATIGSYVIVMMKAMLKKRVLYTLFGCKRVKL